MARLETVDEVVKALGGLSAAAKFFEGGTAQKVWNYRAAGYFPAHTYVALKTALKSRGHDAPEALWRMAGPGSDAEQNNAA